MAIIKLRDKRTTKLSELPTGVFKCILESQFPAILLWRYSDPYMPIIGKHDRQFPDIDKLDFENYLVAIKIR